MAAPFPGHSALQPLATTSAGGCCSRTGWPQRLQKVLIQQQQISQPSRAGLCAWGRLGGCPIKRGWGSRNLLRSPLHQHPGAQIPSAACSTSRGTALVTARAEARGAGGACTGGAQHHRDHSPRHAPSPPQPNAAPPERAPAPGDARFVLRTPGTFEASAIKTKLPSLKGEAQAGQDEISILCDLQPGCGPAAKAELGRGRPPLAHQALPGAVSAFGDPPPYSWVPQA